MGFGFNFKDYNDRLTFKKPILKEVKQTLDEQDFAKAEIAKEKKQKLKKFKEKNSSLEEFFLETVALKKKIRRIFLEFRKMRGVLRPPSRSLVKSKITPPNPLVLKIFLDQKKKKEIGQKRLYVYKVDTNTKSDTLIHIKIWRK